MESPPKLTPPSANAQRTLANVVRDFADSDNIVNKTFTFVTNSILLSYLSFKNYFRMISYIPIGCKVKIHNFPLEIPAILTNIPCRQKPE